MSTVSEKFEAWCIVELFGHAKIAGKCTEQNIAGTNMLRVDVPETPNVPSFTRFFGSSAIYAINPVDENTAKDFAERLQVQPINAWDLKEVLKKHAERGLLTHQANSLVNEDDDDDDDEDYGMDGDDDLPY